MKKYFLRIIPFTLLLGLLSCSDLEEKPYSSITTKNFFTDENDVILAVNGIYEGMHSAGWHAGDASRIVLAPGMFNVSRVVAYRESSTYTIDYTSTQLNNTWKNHYNVINRCNMVIKYAANAEMEEESRNALVAEARWMRAYLYFNLVRLFGDVQMRVTPTETAEDIFLPRTSLRTIYNDVIIPDLEFAKEHLPMTGVSGRIGRGAAPFLLGKVYLTMAGLPLRNKSKLPLAKANLEEVIRNADYGYQLMPRYIDVFSISEDRTEFDGSKELNPELIFVIQQTRAIGNHGTHLAFISGPQGSKWTGYQHGGNHIIGAMAELYHRYDETDERRDISLAYEFVSKNKDADGNNKITKWPYGAAEGRAGMAQNKYIDPEQNGCCNGNPDVILYRLADAYLMLAEVENELNGGPNAYVFDNLDVILNRAKATPVDRGAAWTVDSMRDFIFYERIKEMHFEFHDIYDLRRLGKVKDTFDFNLDAKEGSYDPKYELYPIPRIEVDINPLCTQNKGW